MKKILSLVIALSLVLTSFTSVFAAAPNDVVGTEYEKAVEKLVSLGVLGGYGNGEYRPNNTITRAEFSTAVVRVKGLGSAAEAAKGPTSFADVPANHWASGYINIASKNGIVYGVGNGQFAPEAQITYEQAVTLVLRALGYEPAAVAKGGFPYGYLAVAAEEGLLDGVKGSFGQPASRGLVALLLDNALKIPEMIQVTFGNNQPEWVKSGTKGTEAKYLYEKLGFTKLKGTVSKVDKDRNRITIEYKDKDGDVATKTLKVNKDFDFAGANQSKITVWYDKDDLVHIYNIEDNAKYDAIKEAKDSRYDIRLVGEEKDYDLAKNADIKIDGNTSDLTTLKKGVDYARVLLDSDGDVKYVDAYNLEDDIVVEDVNKNVIFSYDDDELDLKDFTLVKGGKEISSGSLKEGDVVLYNLKAKYAVVLTSDNVKEGKIERVYDKVEFKLGGETYKSRDNAKYLDGKDLGELTSDILGSMKDEGSKVKVVLDFKGNVVLVVGETGETAVSSYALVAKVNKTPSGRYGDEYALDVLTSEGKIVKHNVAKKVVEKFEGWADVNTNDILKLSIDDRGDVTKIEKAGTSDTIKSEVKLDDKYVNGSKLQDSTLIFVANSTVADDQDHKEYKVYTLKEAKKEFTKILSGMSYSDKESRAVAIFVDKTDADSKQEKQQGIVTGIRKLKSGDKYEITLEIDGREESYLASTNVVAKAGGQEEISRVKGIEVEIGDKSKEITNITEMKREVVKVEKVTSKLLNDKYELDSKGKVYNDKLDQISLRELKEGDNVTIFFDGNSSRFIKYVVKAEIGYDLDAGKIESQNVKVNESVEVDVKSAFENVDGLTYEANSKDSEVAIVEKVEGSKVTVKGIKAGEANIEVIAKDGKGGSAKVAFKVIVAEQAKSNDATLSEIKVDGELIAEFASDKDVYNVELASGTTAVPAVTATTTDTKATVEVKDATGLPGATKIVVTAEDGTTTKEYTINFTVAEQAKSNDATLSEIKVGGELIAEFASDKDVYNVELASGTTAVPAVTATTTDTKATVEVKDATGLPGATKIVVTAEDGTTTKEYTINFTVAQ
ncbi:S-layer domain-containing protein [Gottschalkia purinilytica]|uniref:S-layer domain-containing protein n=1 Tax=Gottschalkia purinilytica TaxID=1503 RepID=A0A0L0WEA2_GOTPU|nr:S-layer homology domain-containing protein [Gottschalkia purinilytica]KNF09766.1 S-layer domain-containing protein [Gottschalkia purinilytica]